MFSFPLLQGRLRVAIRPPSLPEGREPGDLGRLNAYSKSIPSPIDPIWTILGIVSLQVCNKGAAHPPVRVGHPIGCGMMK